MPIIFKQVSSQLQTIQSAKELPGDLKRRNSRLFFGLTLKADFSDSNSLDVTCSCIHKRNKSFDKIRQIGRLHEFSNLIRSNTVSFCYSISTSQQKKYSQNVKYRKQCDGLCFYVPPLPAPSNSSVTD